MSWQDQLKGDALSWLLEEGKPGVRYLALRDLLDLPPDSPELRAARAAAHREGPIATVLAVMEPEGYWSKAGPGYNPKYFSSVWALILLAQLGASVEEDERVSRACAYMLEHALAEGGKFSYNGAPGGSFDCLQGNLCWSLREMGCQDARLVAALDWMARSQTGEGIAPATEKHAKDRFTSIKSGPRFACGANYGLACAWGATKVMLALGQLSPAERTPAIERAIQVGIEFMFGVDPATAAYPSRNGKTSPDWWKFGFPVFYITDLLQLAEALVALGAGPDPRLASTLELIRSKQDSSGRWRLEYGYHGKTWLDFDPKRQPNEWVTLRALRVLKKAVVI